MDEQTSVEQDIPDIDSDNRQADPSSTLPGDDGEAETPDYSQILETLFTAKEGDIEEDVFENLKAALALAQDSLCDQVMPVGNEPPWHERAGLDLMTKVQSESVKMRAALQGLVQSERMTRIGTRSTGSITDRGFCVIAFRQHADD